MFANNSDIHTIVIATTNPTKIKAVQDAFHQMFPDLTFQFLSCAAPSGVPDQPMTSAETVQGTFLILSYFYTLDKSDFLGLNLAKF